MSDKINENVILFPKTVEYYQFELTRMLETERYREAIRMLDFLLTCHNQDERIHEEWRALLQWLKTMFPEETLPMAELEDEELSEAELLRQRMADKERDNSGYAERLLDSLQQYPQSVDNLLLALDQLAFLEHPGINQRLTEWVTADERHPLIQYKVLQTLKLRGMTGQLELTKNGETIVVDVEETPSSFEDFPAPISEIIERVQDISQMDQPALAYFAQETWNEFLAYLYGTAQYRQILRQERECVDVWAAAFHFVLLEKVFEDGNKDEILDRYGITNDLMFQWEQAYRVMQSFVAATFSPSPRR
ncbi:hypothetical protein [Paenibacillus xerothermodurans]|uniref:DUF3196 domain-containing protein n=1 Tax=Paenibacillus xerothermodurans TaxID=1977292 RepID=A0A2W1NKM3_PAEXE|nr:hypothetical protein [Paenibacillus xerothermodurans]PZE19945.1 hypothetical protein CBW46_015675 [Paenibacillus xerothermodurans]